MNGIRICLLACACVLAGCGTVSVQNGNMVKGNASSSVNAGPRLSVNVAGASVTAFYGAVLETTRFNEVDAGWVAGEVVEKAVLAHASERGYSSCDIATVLSSDIRKPQDGNKNEWVEEWTVDFCGTTYSVAVNGSGKNNFFSSVKHDVEPATIVGKSPQVGYRTAETDLDTLTRKGTRRAHTEVHSTGPTLDEIYASLSRKEKAKVNRLPPADRADYLATIRDEQGLGR